MTALLPDLGGEEPRPAVVDLRDLTELDLLTLAVADGAGGPVLEVAGELDGHTNGLLRAALAAFPAGSPEVVVDLRGVTFADSSSLGVLVGEHKRLAAAGRRLVLLAPAPAVHRILEVAGLLRILDVRLPQSS